MSSLTEQDFELAVKSLGFTNLSNGVAAVKAVAEVESPKSGFLPSGRPTLLFEAHIFSKNTGHRFDASHPAISSRHWNRKLYKGGEAEWDRLIQALALCRQHNLPESAAWEAASYGRFQIMGFNYKLCGFGAVQEFVTAMKESEGKQLAAFVAFIKARHLDDELRDCRWAALAAGYNGPGYAENQYDTRLAAAYKKFGGK